MHLHILAFFFISFCSACATPEPYGDIQVKVLDNFGFPVSDAKVTIYTNATDFDNETNPIRTTQNTDQNGLTTFFDVRNISDSCYINIISADGIRNNWEGKSKIAFIKTENGFRNLGEFVIFDSRTGIVANAQGKAWRWQRVKINGIDVTSSLSACDLDNLYYFFKSGKYIRDEGATKCDITDEQTTTGSWRFNDSNTGFNVVLGNSINEWIFISFSTNSFQVSQNILFNGVITNVEIVYVEN